MIAPKPITVTIKERMAGLTAVPMASTTGAIKTAVVTMATVPEP